MKREWITEDEAAQLLNYNKKTLRRYCREGNSKVSGIIYTKVNSRTYQYCKRSIDQFKESRSSAMAA